MEHIEPIGEPIEAADAREINGVSYRPIEVLRAPKETGILAAEVRWLAECPECESEFEVYSDQTDDTVELANQLPSMCRECDEDGNDFQTELDRSMSEYEIAQVEAPALSPAIPAVQPLAAREERIMRKNIEVIVAASKAAGLGGWMKISDPTDDVVTNQTELVLTLDELERPDGPERRPLRRSDELGCGVYRKREDVGVYGESNRQAVLIFKLSGRQPTDKDNPKKREAFKVAELKLLERRAAFLMSIGLHVVVTKETDSEGGELPIILVAAILSSPMRSQDAYREFSPANAVITLASMDEREVIDSNHPLTADIFPGGKSADEIVAAALDPNELVKMAADFECCGCNPKIFARMGKRGRAAGKSKPPTFLVDGLIQKGLVTVFAGSAGVGKSTLAHDLAIAAATPLDPGQPSLAWIGREVKSGSSDGSVAYLSGEDNETNFEERAKQLDPDEKADNLYMLPGNKNNLRDLLQDVRGLPHVDLVVVDPARAFIDGNEDQSGAVSEFFDLFVSLADEKNCAVLIIHHMGKGSRITNVIQIKDRMRGSGVFVDRPRMVLGMYRRYNTTVFGIAKSNLIGVAEGTEFHLAHDPETLKHVPTLEASKPQRRESTASKTAAKKSDGQEKVPAAPSPEIILQAMAHFAAKGVPVTKTGPKELYERRKSFQALNGFSRKTIRTVVDEMIVQGRVVQKGGRLSVAGQAA